MIPYAPSNLPFTANSGPRAINHISLVSQGLQYDDFNTIGFYWGIQPIIPGQCVKWSQSGGIGQWKISEISHPQITTTIPIQSWAVFIQTLQANGLMGMVNMAQNYTQVQNVCYAHFGAQYDINVTYEPCICTPVPCDCTPIVGTTGTFTTSASCMTTCCPAPPCTICCQANSSNFPQPPYTWMLTSSVSPCYCPSNSTQLPCITCNKCCTNGTIQTMLGIHDQNCDCAFYGLWSCYLPPCKNCCYNKQTGMVSPAQLPDCKCKPGEFNVPCNSLPNDGPKCLPLDSNTTTPTTTTAITTTTIGIFDDIVSDPADPTNTTVVVGTNTTVTSATKIYVIYDTSSLTTPYITSIQNSVSDWLISNGLTTNNVETIQIGNERWVHWIKTLYSGGFFTPNVGAPAYSDDVLVIEFIDESDAHYHGEDTQPSPNTISNLPVWNTDYDGFKTIHNQITGQGGNFNAVLYATCATNNTYMTRRAFAMQAFQAVSSGNNLPLDGKWQTGTAPRPASQGGTIGGVPELCTNANLEKLEINNPYWIGTTNLKGGLDQFGWKINIRFEPVTSTMLISDLNDFLPPSPPPTPIISPDTPPSVEPIQGFVVVDGPQLPSTYSSAANEAYWLCLYAPYPNGFGAGCYGFDAAGLWTNNNTGVVLQAGCLPWHMGGNCYPAHHNADFPVTINTQSGPVILNSPPEKACAPNCSNS